MTRSPTAVLALQEISSALDISINAIDVRKDLLDNGATSISLVRLHYALKTVGINLRLETMASGIAVEQLIDRHIKRDTVSPSHAARNLKRKAVTTLEPPSKRLTCAIPTDTMTAMPTHKIRYPMTEIQTTLLQSSLSNPGSNIISYHETHSPRDVPALRAAWRKVLRFEPLLSSSYALEGSKAYVVERNDKTMDWKEVMVDDAGSYDREIYNQELAAPAYGNCFRVITLLPRYGNAGKSRVIWRIHHALIDGYAHMLLLSRLEKALKGAILGPTTPFVQFATSLRNLQQDSAASGMEYWAEKQIEHELPSSRLLLPAPTKSPVLRKECDTFERCLDHSILATCCNEVGVTFPTLYYAAWALTMARYTDSSDVLFGTVLSGRSLPIAASTSVIGPTINTLPFHIKIQSSLTVADFLHDVFRNVLELSSMQWTTPNHGFSRDFQTALNIQNNPHFVRRQLVPIEPPFSTMRSDVPLQVEIIRGKTDLIRFHYQLENFDTSQIETLSEVFITALAMVRTPNAKIGSYLSRIIENTHRDTLSDLGNWNGDYNKTGSVEDDLVALFRSTASQYPSATAIQKGSQKMSYEELDSKSSAVARSISRLVRVGDVVCVHADRTLNWIVAIYGVLKAGAIYCPLAEDLPAAVRHANFVASGANLFVTGNDLDERHQPTLCGNTISVEDILLAARTEEKSGKFIAPAVSPSRGAYLCFTSGSTGKPKGVLCQHKGLVAFQRDFDVRLRARPGWKIAQIMSGAFDGSIHELFSTFSYGATLVLRDSNDLSHLSIADAAILTPSVARALDVKSFPNLKTVYFVGEAVTQDLCDSWASEKTVFNMYGPTEATCGATIKQLHPGRPVTLGSAVSSSRIYILDSEQRLAPRGVIGEIFLAGVQVAAGYIGNRKDTENRFVADAINPCLKERMYKTGDKAYWNEDGELMLVGRSDRQVKLRGFRMDLDGLEAQLLHIGAKQFGATQVAITVKDGDLVAYVQPKSLDVDRFRQALRTQVPHYTMPRWILATGAFPMTTAGKRDYKRLESSVKTLYPAASEDNVATRKITPLESVVIATLRETLALPNEVSIHPTSNFVDLGATSVSLLFLSHRLSTTLCRKVALRLVIQCQTPQELAWALSIAELDSANDDVDDDGPVLGETNVSPIESDWWRKYELHDDTSAFNVSFACKLGANIQVNKLMLAWDRVLSHHRILSCNYRREGDLILRTYVNDIPRAEFKNFLDIDTESHVPFDLERSNLIRVLCSRSTMLVVVSHIICDLTTLNSLLDQVADIYACREPRFSSIDFSKTHWAKSISCAQKTFWTRYLQNLRPLATSPGQNTKRTTWKGNSHLVRIAKPTFQRMKKYTSTQKTTMHQLGLAAVSLALQPDESDHDMVMGAPYLNRNPETEMKTIGLFLQPLPIRIKYNSKAFSSLDRNSYIRAVQRASRDALAHALPHDQLLSIVDEPIKSEIQLLDYMVTFHEAADMPKLAIHGVEPIHTWTRGAKFKLMAEFAAVADGSLEMRLEYSTDCFSDAEVHVVGERISAAIQGLIGEIPFEDIKQCVRAVQL
jgi:amino acid adenylation domain-containing protein